MPEGHTIRYMANVHEKLFAESIISASSPQGRFVDEAAQITGTSLTGTSTHGKHLFLHFGDKAVHVHLGLYGWFNFSPGHRAPNKPSVRLRLDNGTYVSDLAGPTTCELIDADDVKSITSKLGPDPLHTGANSDDAWSKIAKSKKSIASLLMNQSVIAGIGNVYRAELLFLARCNPYTLGNELQRETFDTIWTDAVRLLHEGAKDGMIRTVDPRYYYEYEIVDEKYRQQGSYVYKRTGCDCRICGDIVKSANVDGRTLYWCPTCQK